VERIAIASGCGSLVSTENGCVRHAFSDTRGPECHDGAMPDAPTFRIWPPVALGVPLLAGVVITASAGDPFPMPSLATRTVGTILIAVFAV